MRKKRIVTQTHAEELVAGELETAGQDLESSRNTFSESDYKWATIQAYYSIFHAARALLFERGFREKSHFCLKAAIQELYADAGLIEHNDRDALNNGMLRRQKSSGEQIADLFAKE
ncbi:MAG: HEPN domain-containing protein [Thermoleophilia bacterium]